MYLPRFLKTAYIHIRISSPSYTITTFRRRLPSLLRSSPSPLLFLSLRCLDCDGDLHLYIALGIGFYRHLMMGGCIGVGVGVRGEGLRIG